MIRRGQFAAATRPVLIAATLLGSLLIPLSADEPLSGFSTLREKQQLQSVQDVRDWVLANPESPEVHDAARWCLSECLTLGRYAVAAPVAERVLADESASATSQTLARQVRCLALAATNDPAGALQLFREELKRIRLRNPNDTLEFAFALCGQFQIVGEIEAAREVLKETANAFFLNEEVRTLCDRRQAKLLLIDSTPADFAWTDVNGKPGTLAQRRGKPTLIDFWATNCPPCIADLPALKAAYHRHQPHIVGLSLDRAELEVREFAQDRHVNWPLALVTSSPDSPRENFRVITIPSTFLLDAEGKIVLVDGTAREINLMLEKMSQSTTEPSEK